MLLITLDTTRADHLGCYGHEGIRTPAIDGLAREGVLFERAYSTQPVTLPSHSSILTGRWPHRHGVRDNNTYRLGSEQVTLAELLAAEGYLTTAFVASFILDRRFGLAQGFRYYNDSFVKPKQRGRLPVDRRAGEVSLLAREWFDASAAERGTAPFFLWLHYYDPHADYDPPAPFRTAYTNPYDGEIAYTDQWLGYLFDELRALGLWEDTIVVLTADHGDSLGEHGEETHGIFVYSATTRVPLIIRAPGRLPSGRRIAQPVSHVDIVPTVLELLDLPPREGTLDGISLVTAARQGAAPAGRNLYSETFIPAGFGWATPRAVRRDGWLYVGTPRPEVYGPDDPYERFDLGPRHPEKLAELAQHLATLTAGQPAPEAKAAPLDGATAEKLKALGYFVADEDQVLDPLAGKDPKDRIASFNRYQIASSLMARGAFAEAIPHFEALCAADPGNRRFRAELAGALEDAGRSGEAAKQLTLLLEEAPDDVSALFQLVRIRERIGQIGPAREGLLAIIRNRPRHLRARFALGRLEISAGRWSEAAQALEGARRIAPNDPRVLNNLAFVQIKGLAQLDEGLRTLRRAHALAPDDAEITASLGSAELGVGHLDKAIALLESALEKLPLNLAVIDELRQAYLTAGRDADAARLAARRRALAP